MFSRTAKSTLRALIRRYVLRYQWIVVSALVSFAVCYCVPFLWTTAKARYLDVLQTRTLFSLRGPLPPPNDVAILALDDRTFGALNISLNRYIPRHFIASAFEALITAPPKVLILDSFALPDDREPEADQRLAAALSKLPSTMALGTYGTVAGTLDRDLLFPTDSLFLNAVRFSLTMEFDREQDIVWFLGKPRENDYSDPHLQFPLLKPLTDLGGYQINAPHPYTLVNFYGPPGSISHVSLHELFDEQTRESAIKRLHNKVVLFGTQRSTEREKALIGRDSFSISYSTGAMFGVEIWAHMAANLIDSSYIRRLSPHAELGLLFSLTAASCFFLLFYPSVLNFILAFLLWLLYAATAYVSFVHFQLFLPGVFFLFLSTTAIAVVGVSLEKFRIFLLRRSVKKDLGLDIAYGKQ